MELKSAGTPYTYAIRHEGIIEAGTAKTDASGRVFLVSKAGKIETSGTIIAPGGEIHVIGDRTRGKQLCTLYLFSEWRRSHLHRIRHGKWLTWTRHLGERQGAKIHADALHFGEGGEVRIFGDQIATCYGNVTACGGTKGGNGGFVDLSAAWVDFAPKISTAAANGKVGEFRLDPNDITISVGPTNSPIASPFAFFDGADVPKANLNVTALQTSLNHNSVTIQTNAGTFGGSGDISINNNLNWSNGNSLVIHALRHIHVNASITSNSANPHGIQLISDTGNIHINQNVVSNGNGKIDVQANAPLGGDILFSKADHGLLRIGSVGNEVSLYATRDIKLIAGKDQSDQIVQVGMNPLIAQGAINSNVDIHAGRDFIMTSSKGSAAYVGHIHRIDQTTRSLAGNAQGTIHIQAGRTIVMASEHPTPLQIGHGAPSSGDTKLSGDIQVAAGGSLQMLPGARIGHGDSEQAATTSHIQGHLTVQAADILLQGNQARIGHQTHTQHTTITNSNIAVRTTTGDIFMDQGDASIGHFIEQGTIDVQSIQVASAQDIQVDGQNTIIAGAFSGIGTVQVGKIDVQTARDLKIAPSTSPLTQIGALVGKGRSASSLNISVGRNLETESYLHITNGNDLSSNLPLNIHVTGNSILEADIYSIGSLDFRSGGNLLFTGGTIHSNKNAEITADTIFLDGPATLVGVTNGDLNMIARNRILMNGDARIFNEPAAGDITLQTLFKHIEMSGNASIRRNSSGEVLLLANQDILIQDSASITGNTLGKITLVADNQEPTAPFGTGRFLLGPHASIGSTGEAHDQVRVYTAVQSLNTIEGTLNGQPFEPDTLYDHTSTNRWMTHYPATFVGPAYTVFYRDGNTPPPPDPIIDPPRTRPTSSELEQVEVANAEMFYKVAWIEDQVILLPMSILYDRVYFGKGLSSYTLDFDACLPFIRHKSVENAEETTPFDYRY